MQTLLLLDLDGTVLDTPHYEAWRYAARQVGIADFTYREYVIYVAGRPRLEGASRLLELKKLDAQRTPCGSYDGVALAQAKQLEFLRLAEQTRLFDDALRLLQRIKASRQLVRFYTASENAPRLLEAALRKSGPSFLRECIAQQPPGQSREALFASLASQHPTAAITLVDDAPHAVDAACRLGMRGYQIRRNAYQPTATVPSARAIPSLDDIAMPLLD